MEPTIESGLGLFLKGERERKGLSLEYVAKVTRLRRHYLDALENEDWGKLPSRVFIKGFIKTYTKALGLDYTEVMGQYESAIPVQIELPKPLVAPKKIRKKYIFLIILLILIAFFFVVFFIKDPMSLFKRTEATPAKGPEDKVVQSLDHDKDNKQGQLLNQDSAISSENSLGAAGKAETLPAEEAVPASELNAPPQDVPVQNAAQAPVQVPVQVPVQASVQTPVQTPVVKTVEEPIKQVKEKYTLAAFVTQTTYIKIYADNNPPQEYIFSPGSHKEWTGKEGFYILVGNAAGIEFNFNGKRIKDLGDPGKVVRLRLPENFNLNINEN